MTTDGTRELIAEAEKLLEDFGGGYQDYPGGPTKEYLGFDVIKRLADALEAATRERDAALAVIERVRAVCLRLGQVDSDVSHPAPSYYVSVGRNVVATEILAALDGAPEPEEKPDWEYRWGDPRQDFAGFVGFSSEAEARADMETHSEYDSDQVLRRREAGPWLPVEGEKP